MSDVGERIAVLRQAMGFTQEDLAKHLAVDQGTISRIELGKANISLERAVQIAEFLNVPIETFIRGRSKGRRS